MVTPIVEGRMQKALTLRQAECLEYKARGLSLRAIGRELGISHVAVIKHLKNAVQRQAGFAEYVHARPPADVNNIDPRRVAAAI